VFEKTGKHKRTPFKHTPLTQPIAKFLAKPQAGKYPPQGDLQLRVDLEVMILVATSNIPFSWVVSPQFKRYDSELSTRCTCHKPLDVKRTVCLLYDIVTIYQLDIPVKRNCKIFKNANDELYVISN
jgi:hypothetical protein